MKPAEQGRALKKADLRQYRAETTFLSEGSIRFSGGLFQPAQRTWRICPAGVKGRQKSVVHALHSSQGRVWCRGPVLVYGVKELVFRQAVPHKAATLSEGPGWWVGMEYTVPGTDGLWVWKGETSGSLRGSANSFIFPVVRFHLFLGQEEKPSSLHQMGLETDS